MSGRLFVQTGDERLKARPRGPTRGEAVAGGRADRLPRAQGATSARADQLHPRTAAPAEPPRPEPLLGCPAVPRWDLGTTGVLGSARELGPDVVRAAAVEAEPQRLRLGATRL